MANISIKSPEEIEGMRVAGRPPVRLHHPFDYKPLGALLLTGRA